MHPEVWQRGYQLNFLSHLECADVLLASMRAAPWGRDQRDGGHFRHPRQLNTGTAARAAMTSMFKAMSITLTGRSHD